MRLTKFYCLTILAIIFAGGSLFSQVKPNDYTQQNQGFKKDSLEKQNWYNNEKIWQRESETFQTKDYTPMQDAGYLNEKRASLGDDTAAKNMEGMRSDIFSQQFNGAPELRDDFKKQWTAPSDNVFFENKDKDLSKKYEGTIDFKKMNQYNALMKECMEEIQEKSMQDINKYMFRSSHSTDAGIPTSTAGGQALGISDEEEESSFLDDLFFWESTSTVRSPVSFQKGVNVGTIAKSNSENLGTVAKMPEKNEQKILPPMIVADGQKKREVVGAPKEDKIKVVEQEFRKESTLFAPQTDSNAPIKASNKFKIKVEVSNPQ